MDLCEEEDLTHWGLSYFGGGCGFQELLYRHHSQIRVVMILWFLTNKSYLSVSFCSPWRRIWLMTEKKKSMCAERKLIISQTERKPERSRSLPVAHSCARLHSRNAALRSVIVSVQWAWHGHSVKNNSAQKQRFRLHQQVWQNLQRTLCSLVIWLWNRLGNQCLLRAAN